MADKSKTARLDREDAGREVAAGGHLEGKPGQAVPLARQRARSTRQDKQGHRLKKQASYFREDLYEQYRRIAFFRKQNTYDLINEAMAAYLSQLKTREAERLRAAGQAELPLHDASASPV